MKQFFNKAISIVVILSFSLSMISCSSNSSQSGTSAQTTSATTTAAPTPTPIPACPEEAIIIGGDVVFGLMFDDFYQVNCENGDSIELEYNYQPRDVNIAIEEWSSSDESVATVSNSGVVTPVGMGECEITLHITDGLSDGAYATVNVSVESGIVQIDNQTLPTYDELKSNIEAVYGNDFLLVYDDYYGFYRYEDYDVLPFIGCEYYTSDFYNDYPPEELYRGMNCRYQAFQNDSYLILIDGDGITVRCDEYLLFIYAYYGDIEDSMDIAESFGISIPRELIDVDMLTSE